MSQRFFSFNCLELQLSTGLLNVSHDLRLLQSGDIWFIPVSVCFFPHDISKIDAARIAKLDKKFSTLSPENPFILASKVQRSRGAKHYRRAGVLALL